MTPVTKERTDLMMRHPSTVITCGLLALASVGCVDDTQPLSNPFGPSEMTSTESADVTQDVTITITLPGPDPTPKDEPKAPENRPPSLTAPAAQTWTVGQFVILPVTATDPEADALTWELTGCAAGLDVTTSGTISGTIAEGAHLLSPYLCRVSVSDGDLVDTADFVAIVEPAV